MHHKYIIVVQSQLLEVLAHGVPKAVYNVYTFPRLKVLTFRKKENMKCYIPPNEVLVQCCTLLGLIQILLNNHKFLKCENSAQNVSFLSQNHFFTFLSRLQ